MDHSRQIFAKRTQQRWRSAFHPDFTEYMNTLRPPGVDVICGSFQLCVSICQSADRALELTHPQQRIEDIRRVHDAIGEVAAFLQRNDGGEIETCEYKNNLLGLVETGLVTVRMKQAASSTAVVLVSRREHREGKGPCVETAPVTFVPMGSIAYRLAQVAVGADSASSTFEPRHESDIAGGTALVRAAGGEVRCPKKEIRFNQSIPRFDSVFAFSPSCEPAVRASVLGGQP